MSGIMEQEAIREFVDLKVDELSVVDSPANELEFIVIKCKDQEGNNDMAEKKSDVKQEVTASVEKDKNAGNSANVEKVAVEVEKSTDAGVAAAMESVKETVESIAKQVGIQQEETEAVSEETETEATTDTESVEKALRDAGVPEETIQKALEGIASEKVEKSVEKSESDNGSDVLGALEAAIAKAKVFTPENEEILKNAVEQLTKMMAALQPQKGMVVTTPKNNLPSKASVAPAQLTAVTKQIEEMTAAITKSLETISESQKKLATRVETIEKSRTPSKAIGDGTDSTPSVKTEKSFWGRIL